MQTRRDFVRSAAATLGLALTPAGALAADELRDPGTKRLRTITYNVLKCQGYARTPEAKALLPAMQADLPAQVASELARYSPDIITFQEGPPANVVAAMAEQLGMHHTFFRGTWDDGWPGAVLSKHEISAAETRPLVSWSSRPKGLFTRHWGRAVLRTPLGDIALFSAHLHPSDDAVRAREIDEMLNVMKPALAAGGLVILQGDLNHSPSDLEYARWKEAGMVDAFDRKTSDSIEHSFNSHRPRVRIDYIWTSQTLAQRGRECRVLFELAFKMNPDDPNSIALSDHLPVLADFEL